jgi:hypothetical protein
MGILMAKSPKEIQYDHPAYKAWMEREKKAIAREMRELTKKKK